jgi:hypothetical protein
MTEIVAAHVKTSAERKDYDYAHSSAEGPASLRQAARDLRREATTLVGKSLAEAEVRKTGVAEGRRGAPAMATAMTS